MKYPLEVVTFDTDVHGPGPKQQAMLTSTFAHQRVVAGGKTTTLDIEHDVERGAVVITMPGASERPVVMVPWSRVRHCQPLTDAQARPAAAPKK